MAWFAASRQKNTRIAEKAPGLNKNSNPRFSVGLPAKYVDTLIDSVLSRLAVRD
jgi:hypothetical protein